MAALDSWAPVVVCPQATLPSYSRVTELNSLLYSDIVYNAADRQSYSPNLLYKSTI